MPMKNFWSARITNPSKYKDFAYDQDKFGKGIDVVYGLKDKKGPKGGKSEVQSIRFNKTNFKDKDDVKVWMKDKKKRYLKIESNVISVSNAISEIFSGSDIRNVLLED